MIKYRCTACGEAENCDMFCEVISNYPITAKICPMSGEECEWVEVHEKRVDKTENKK